MKTIHYVGCKDIPEARYGQLLRASGYKVTIGTIDQVIPELRSGRLSADLVIVDCPSLSLAGEDLLRQIRQVAPEIPFILLAKSVTVESYLRSLAIGFYEYLCKPVDDGELLNSVRALMREARSTKEASSDERRQAS